MKHFPSSSAAAVFFRPAYGQPVPFRQFQVDLSAELVLLLRQEAEDLLFLQGDFGPQEITEFFSEFGLLGGEIEIHGLFVGGSQRK